MTTTTEVRASDGGLTGFGGLGGPKNFDHRRNITPTSPAITITPTTKAATMNVPICKIEFASSSGTNKAWPVTAWQMASSEPDTTANGLLIGVLGHASHWCCKAEMAFV